MPSKSKRDEYPPKQSRDDRSSKQNNQDDRRQDRREDRETPRSRKSGRKGDDSLPASHDISQRRRERSRSEERTSSRRDSDRPRSDRQPRRRHTESESNITMASTGVPLTSTIDTGSRSKQSKTTASTTSNQNPRDPDPKTQNSRGDRPVPLSDHVPDMFPGQFPAGPSASAAPYRPPLAASEGGPGLASDYYGTAASKPINTQSSLSNAASLLMSAGSNTNARPGSSVSGSFGGAASSYGNPTHPQSTAPDSDLYTSSVAPSLVNANGTAPSLGTAATASSRPPRPQEHGSSALPYLGAAAAIGAAGFAAAHHGHGASQTPTFGQQAGSNLAFSQAHRHKGPFAKFVDFFKDPEGVGRFEEYTEYIGVCRDCFEPGSSAQNAPRRHNFRKRRSFERNSNPRVDKDFRYASTGLNANDPNRNRTAKVGTGIAAGLAGYGLAQVGKKFFGDPRDFDDTHSVQTGEYRDPGLAAYAAHRQPSRDSRQPRVPEGTRRYAMATHDNGSVEYGLAGMDSQTTLQQNQASRQSQAGRSGRSHNGSDLAGAALAGAAAATLSRSSRHSPTRREDPRHSAQKVRRSASQSSGSSKRRRRRRKSSTSSSEGGFLAGIFGSGSKRKGRSRPHFHGAQPSQGYSSSSLSDEGHASHDRDRQRKTKALADRQRKGEGSANRIKTASDANAALIGLGAAAAALAAHESRRDKSGGRHPADLVGPAHESRRAGIETRRVDENGRQIFDNRDDDESWESASEGDSASIDSALAFGTTSPIRRRRSQDSLSDSGTDKWDWRWRRNRSPRRRDSSGPAGCPSREAVHSDKLPAMVAGGAAAAAAAAGIMAGAAQDHSSKKPSVADPARSNRDTEPLPPMQYVHPVPTADPTRFDVDSASYDRDQPQAREGVRPRVDASVAARARSDSLPMQQPRPIAPVHNNVYDASDAYRSRRDYSAQDNFRSSGDTRSDAVRTGRGDDRDLRSDSHGVRDDTPDYRDRSKQTNAALSLVSPADADGQRSGRRRIAPLREDESFRRIRMEDLSDYDFPGPSSSAVARPSRDHAYYSSDPEESERHARRRQDDYMQHLHELMKEEAPAGKPRKGKEVDRFESKTLAKQSDFANAKDSAASKDIHDDVSPSSKAGKMAFAGIVAAAAATGGAAVVEKRRSDKKNRGNDRGGARDYSSDRDIDSDHEQEDENIQERRLARQAAAKVRRASTSPAAKHESYVDYFTPEDIIARPARGKEKITDPTAAADNVVYDAPDIVTGGPAVILDRSRDPSQERRSSFAPPDLYTPFVDKGVHDFPWQVPLLALIRPTPSVSRANSFAGSRHASPSRDPDASRDSPVQDSARGSTRDSARDSVKDSKAQDASDKDSSRFDKDRDASAETSDARRGRRSRDRSDSPSDQGASFDDAASDDVSPKSKPQRVKASDNEDVRRSSPPKTMPGQFDDDTDFAATLAAGLEDSGFDPNIVIKDSSYRRRDSPPGSQDELDSGSRPSPPAKIKSRRRKDSDRDRTDARHDKDNKQGDREFDEGSAAVGAGVGAAAAAWMLNRHRHNSAKGATPDTSRNENEPPSDDADNYQKRERRTPDDAADGEAIDGKSSAARPTALDEDEPFEESAKMSKKQKRKSKEAKRKSLRKRDDSPEVATSQPASEQDAVYDSPSNIDEDKTSRVKSDDLERAKGNSEEPDEFSWTTSSTKKQKKKSKKDKRRTADEFPAYDETQPQDSEFTSKSFLGERPVPEKPPDDRYSTHQRSSSVTESFGSGPESSAGRHRVSERPTSTSRISTENSGSPQDSVELEHDFEHDSDPRASRQEWSPSGRHYSNFNADLGHAGTISSPTAVPLVFRRPPQSGSGRSASGVTHGFQTAARSAPGSPAASPAILAAAQATGIGAAPRSRRQRPLSKEFKSNEFRPLWLVEQHQKKSVADVEPLEERYPSLPPSEATSRASSVDRQSSSPQKFSNERRRNSTPESKIKAFDRDHHVRDIDASQQTPRRGSLDRQDSQQATPTAAAFGAKAKREQDLLDAALQDSLAREIEWQRRQSMGESLRQTAASPTAQTPTRKDHSVEKVAIPGREIRKGSTESGSFAGARQSSRGETTPQQLSSSSRYLDEDISPHARIERQGSDYFSSQPVPIPAERTETSISGAEHAYPSTRKHSGPSKTSVAALAASGALGAAAAAFAFSEADAQGSRRTENENEKNRKTQGNTSDDVDLRENRSLTSTERKKPFLHDPFTNEGSSERVDGRDDDERLRAISSHSRGSFADDNDDHKAVADQKHSQATVSADSLDQPPLQTPSRKSKKAKKKNKLSLIASDSLQDEYDDEHAPLDEHAPASAAQSADASAVDAPSISAANLETDNFDADKAQGSPQRKTSQSSIRSGENAALYVMPPGLLGPVALTKRSDEHRQSVDDASKQRAGETFEPIQDEALQKSPCDDTNTLLDQERPEVSTLVPSGKKSKKEKKKKKQLFTWNDVEDTPANEAETMNDPASSAPDDMTSVGQRKEAETAGPDLQDSGLTSGQAHGDSSSTKARQLDFEDALQPSSGSKDMNQPNLGRAGPKTLSKKDKKKAKKAKAAAAARETDVGLEPHRPDEEMIPQRKQSNEFDTSRGPSSMSEQEPDLQDHLKDSEALGSALALASPFKSHETVDLGSSDGRSEYIAPFKKEVEASTSGIQSPFVEEDEREEAIGSASPVTMTNKDDDIFTRSERSGDKDKKAKRASKVSFDLPEDEQVVDPRTEDVTAGDEAFETIGSKKSSKKQRKKDEMAEALLADKAKESTQEYWGTHPENAPAESAAPGSDQFTAEEMAGLVDSDPETNVVEREAKYSTKDTARLDQANTQPSEPTIERAEDIEEHDAHDILPETSPGPEHRKVVDDESKQPQPDQAEASTGASDLFEPVSTSTKRKKEKKKKGRTQVFQWSDPDNDTAQADQSAIADLSGSKDAVSSDAMQDSNPRFLSEHDGDGLLGTEDSTGSHSSNALVDDHRDGAEQLSRKLFGPSVTQNSMEMFPVENDQYLAASTDHLPQKHVMQEPVAKELATEQQSSDIPMPENEYVLPARDHTLDTAKSSDKGITNEPVASLDEAEKPEIARDVAARDSNDADSFSAFTLKPSKKDKKKAKKAKKLADVDAVATQFGEDQSIDNAPDVGMDPPESSEKHSEIVEPESQRDSSNMPRTTLEQSPAQLDSHDSKTAVDDAESSIKVGKSNESEDWSQPSPKKSKKEKRKNKKALFTDWQEAQPPSEHEQQAQVASSQTTLHDDDTKAANDSLAEATYQDGADPAQPREMPEDPSVPSFSRKLNKKDRKKAKKAQAQQWEATAEEDAPTLLSTRTSQHDKMPGAFGTDSDHEDASAESRVQDEAVNVKEPHGPPVQSTTTANADDVDVSTGRRADTETEHQATPGESSEANLEKTVDSAALSPGAVQEYGQTQAADTEPWEDTTPSKRKKGKKAKKGKREADMADRTMATEEDAGPTTFEDRTIATRHDGPATEALDTIAAAGTGLLVSEALGRHRSKSAHHADESTGLREERHQDQQLPGEHVDEDGFPKSSPDDKYTEAPITGYNPRQRDSALDMPLSPDPIVPHFSSDRIRDSGYQGTEPSPTLPRDPDFAAMRRSDSQSPVQTPAQSPTRDDERPLEVSIEVSPDCDYSVSQPRRRRRKGSQARDRRADDGHHVPSSYPITSPSSDHFEQGPTTVDSTTKARSAALFDSSPSTREAIVDHQASLHADDDSALVSRANSNRTDTERQSTELDDPINVHDKDSMIRSPPQTPMPFESVSRPLTTIAEQSHPSTQFDPNQADVVDEQSLRTSTPRLNRSNKASQQRLRSPGSDSSARRLGLISTDDLISRLSWPEVDEDAQSVDLDHNRSHGGRQSSIASDNLRRASADQERRSVSRASMTSANSISAAIIHSPSLPAASTPPLLRREKRSISSDLHSSSHAENTGSGKPNNNSAKPKAAKSRAVSARRDQPRATAVDEAEVIASSSSYDPVRDKGKAPIVKMADVYEGWGDHQQSPTSTGRPPSLRKRQSLQIVDLETRLDQIVSENRLLQDAKSRAERNLDQAVHDHRQESHALTEAIQTRDVYLRQKSEELEELQNTLRDLREEVTRLNEHNADLGGTRGTSDDNWEQRYRELEDQHQTTRRDLEDSTRELETIRHKHTSLSGGMEAIVANEVAVALRGRNEEIDELRDGLDAAQQEVQVLKQEILALRNHGGDDLSEHDEDYFDSRCQQLCQHVQQWVLRFSKFSDMKACRRMDDVMDEKITDRFDNVILDGTDVDRYLSDRVKRRDVFMSVVMSMIWEYIFTRYLFGMDREQRQKLKSLEKTLAETGSPAAVNRWRATTLSMLSKRDAFHQQREQDTEAVVHEILHTLAAFLPPPTHLVDQIQESLRKVLRLAVDLSVDMRTQRAEYIMLPPLQPEYNTQGDLERKVYFNAELMNERSGQTSSNDELQDKQAVVRIVLFPLVVKQGDDDGLGDERVVVCPAQVLVAATDDEPPRAVEGRKGAVSALDNRSLGSVAPSQTEGGMF